MQRESSPPFVEHYNLKDRLLVTISIRVPKLIVPREHGAWAVLLVPLAIGAGCAGEFTLDLLWLLGASLGAFMSYVPNQFLLHHAFGNRLTSQKLRQARFWAITYLGLGILFALPLAIKGLWLIVPLGVVGTAVFTGNYILAKHHGKTITGDLLAVSGLTLTGPAAYYVVTGRIDDSAILLWGLSILFFGSSVLYVHMKIRAASFGKEKLSVLKKLSLGAMNIAYGLSVLAIVWTLTSVDLLPVYTIFAFLPMVVHVIFGTFSLTGRVRFRNLGFILVGQSVVFALLMILP